MSSVGEIIWSADMGCGDIIGITAANGVLYIATTRLVYKHELNPPEPCEPLPSGSFPPDYGPGT